MAKRKRSAAQKRNDKRLGAMARARGRTIAPRRRRRSVRKTIKRVSRRIPRMARRRRAPARRRSSGATGILGKIPLINNPTFRKAATGIGIATLGAAVIGIVAPSFAANPIVKPVLALAGGGIPGVAAQIFTQGGLGGLGNILGGGGNGGGGGPTPGFG